MRQISNSEIKTFKMCRRKWALAWHYGYAIPEHEIPAASVIQLGNRVHAAFEAHYGYGIQAEGALDVLYRDAIMHHGEVEPALTREWRQAKIMVSGYLEWAAVDGTDETYEVVATEQDLTHEIELDGGDAFILRGKLDQIIRRREDGALLFRDWKTVGTLSKANLLALDEQMRTYALLHALVSRETGDTVAGGLYTMLLRSMRTSRATGPFYAVEEVRYTKDDMNSMWYRIRAVAAELLSVARQLDSGADFRGIAYPNPGDHCAYMCPFLSICPLFDDGSRVWDAMDANFEKRPPYAYYGTEMIDLIKSAHVEGSESV